MLVRGITVPSMERPIHSDSLRETHRVSLVEMGATQILMAVQHLKKGYRFRWRAEARDRAGFDTDFLLFLAFDRTRSGSRFAPVSRFHSSNVAGVILPSTSNCANFRRCA